MNKTVTLPEIAAQVAAMAGVDVDMATRFIAAMFAGVEQNLLAGESVTLDGIGTFRRSTSQLSAVEFEPDKDLAAAVNAPFALFSPVEMPADATPDIFDEKKAEEETEAAAEIPAVEETVQETTESETQPEEEEIQEQEPEIEAEEEITEEELPADDTDTEKEVVYIERRRSPWPWIAAIIALAAGFGGGYFFGFRNSTVSGIEPPLAAAETVEKTDTIVVPAEPESTCDTIAAEETAEEIVKEEKEPEAAKEPVYDTVSPSRFLTTISRDHYGRKDYWVFIYEANADILKHPNRIRPGTRVLIPDLGPHAALDPDMRARARALATDIYNRYDM